MASGAGGGSQGGGLGPTLLKAEFIRDAVLQRRPTTSAGGARASATQGASPPVLIVGTAAGGAPAVDQSGSGADPTTGFPHPSYMTQGSSNMAGGYPPASALPYGGSSARARRSIDLLYAPVIAGPNASVDPYSASAAAGGAGGVPAPGVASAAAAGDPSSKGLARVTYPPLAPPPAGPPAAAGAAATIPAAGASIPAATLSASGRMQPAAAAGGVPTSPSHASLMSMAQAAASARDTRPSGESTADGSTMAAPAAELNAEVMDSLLAGRAATQVGGVGSPLAAAAAALQQQQTQAYAAAPGSVASLPSAAYAASLQQQQQQQQQAAATALAVQQVLAGGGAAQLQAQVHAIQAYQQQLVAAHYAAAFGLAPNQVSAALEAEVPTAGSAAAQLAAYQNAFAAGASGLTNPLNSGQQEVPSGAAPDMFAKGEAEPASPYVSTASGVTAPPAPTSVDYNNMPPAPASQDYSFLPAPVSRDYGYAFPPAPVSMDYNFPPAPVSQSYGAASAAMQQQVPLQAQASVASSAVPSVTPSMAANQAAAAAAAAMLGVPSAAGGLLGTTAAAAANPALANLYPTSLGPMPPTAGTLAAAQVAAAQSAALQSAAALSAGVAPSSIASTAPTLMPSISARGPVSASDGGSESVAALIQAATSAAMQQQAMDAFTAGHALANAAASMAAGNPLFAAHPTTSSAAILAAASAAQQQQQQQQRAAVAATLAAQQQAQLYSGLLGAGTSAALTSAPTAPSVVSSITAATERKDTVSEKVKALVQMGGYFSRTLGTSAAEYLGGETRLVTIPLTILTKGQGAFAALLQHLSITTGGQLDDTCILRYELPGSQPQTHVDLLNDADVANMADVWEEYRGTTAAAAAAAAVGGSSSASVASSAAAMAAASKLRIFVEQPDAAGYAALQAAQDGVPSAVGSAQHTGGSSLSHPGKGVSYEAVPADSSHGTGTGGRGSTESTATRTRPSGGQLLGAGGSSGTAGPGGASDGGEPKRQGTAGSRADTSISALRAQSQALSDIPSLAEMVSSTPRVALSDLEARLEVLKPEDLRISRFLGAGGYGEVYLCKWASVDVAVKCLSPSLLGPSLMMDAAGSNRPLPSDAVAELIKEAMMLSSLRHPNVVWVYGIVLPPHLELIKQAAMKLGMERQIDAVSFSTDAASRAGVMPGMVRPPALVTEYMAGGSMRAALSRKADFLRSPLSRVKLALDAARGMEYLHSKRIVHFDLKSANVLVGWREGSPLAKVADFGLSKQRQQTYVTGVNTLRGTLPWTAPEIIHSPKAVTDKVDVFSFGIMMWELLTGKEPWDGLNYHALLHQMSTNKALRPPLPGSPDWEGDPVDELVPGWNDLMCQCWSDDAQSRPPFAVIVPKLQAMLADARMGTVGSTTSSSALGGTDGSGSARGGRAQQ